MLTASDVVRAAIPDADATLADHILWSRTCWPCGPVTPRDLFRAASAYRRAHEHGLVLCDWCHNLAEPQDSCLCNSCREALAAPHPDSL